MTGHGGAEPLLRVQDLCVQFESGPRPSRVVRDVSFSVAAGDTVALVGESGSGKSVTARTIMRLLEPTARVTAGAVWFGGRDLLGLSEREMRALRGGEVALILQDAMTGLNPAHPVGFQVAESLRVHRGLRRADALEEAIALLDRVGIREPRQTARRYPHQLSGGMRQRVVVASALACQPKLIIADEPTTALDVTIQAQILQLLAELAHEHQTALLLITHDLGIVGDVAQRVVVMYAGEVVEQGDVAEVLARPAHPYTRGLLGSLPGQAVKGQPLPAIRGQIPSPDDLPSGCVFHPRCDHALESCATSHPAVRPRPSGDGTVACPLTVESKPILVRGQDDALRPVFGEPRREVRREVLLEVRDLRKTFTSRGLLAGRQRASTAAVDGVSFSVRPGTTLGIVGESGSGKSTTARLIARLLDPTSGTVTLDGEELTKLRGDDLRQMRRHVQIVFQDALGSLDPRRRVGSAIREPLRAFGEPATKARVVETLELVGLSAQHAERAPHELSGGQRQRVAIARALALRPKVLICDEPVASLDVSIQAQVINLLRRLQAELGLAYIFISHDLSLVRHVSDETVVMLSGRVVEVGPTEQLWSDPQHAYTQALLAAIPGRAASGRAVAV